MGADEARAAMDAAYILELMRAFLREEIGRIGERAAARQLRVRPATLRAFIDGGLPGRKLWASATELALDRPLPALAPEAVAVAMLADTFPPPRRAEMRERFREALRPLLELEGRPVPWQGAGAACR